MSLSPGKAKEYSDFFEENGYLVVPGFASNDECEGMMERMDSLLEAWDPDHTLEVFRTDEQQTSAQGSSKYFLDSSHGVAFFLEPDALDATTGKIKDGLDKRQAVNKAGHYLHVVDEVFKEYSESPKVASLVSALGWVAPVLPQSMYIFKQPKIGEVVTSHQDSTFLHTQPRTTCLGLWLALQDATLDNGCLWARPGSHKEPVRRQMVRNPEFFESGTGPMTVFKDLVPPEDQKAWEGGLPQGDSVEDSGFKAVPMKQGDLFVIHGSLDHLSLPNSSPHSRHTFQLHLIEGQSEGITWSAENWQQAQPGTTFPPIPMN